MGPLAQGTVLVLVHWNAHIICGHGCCAETQKPAHLGFFLELGQLGTHRKTLSELQQSGVYLHRHRTQLEECTTLPRVSACLNTQVLVAPNNFALITVTQFIQFPVQYILRELGSQSSFATGLLLIKGAVWFWYWRPKFHLDLTSCIRRFSAEARSLHVHGYK